jgi:beta-lactamase class A
MNKFTIIILSSGMLLIGFFAGRWLHVTEHAKNNYSEQHSGQSKLTNKLLDFDIPPSNELGEYKFKLQDLINNYIKNKKAMDVAVYFRDLNNGPWIGVNAEDKFIPASLLKMPLMMAYFKKSEINPSLLGKKYTYHAGKFGIASSQKFSKPTTLKEGKEYTVNELIRRMIVNSDNEALFLIANDVDANELNKLYSTLGFPVPADISFDTEFISPRNIGSFFRVLYNATYLNEELSEKALKLLTETDFENGIVSGVPKGITVAQKYGERGKNGIRELHDCGIVYFPDHPYILCIMTKGLDYSNLAGIIRDISKLTYEHVDKSNQLQ